MHYSIVPEFRPYFLKPYYLFIDESFLEHIALKWSFFNVVCFQFPKNSFCKTKIDKFIKSGRDHINSFLVLTRAEVICLWKILGWRRWIRKDCSTLSESSAKYYRLRWKKRYKFLKLSSFIWKNSFFLKFRSYLYFNNTYSPPPPRTPVFLFLLFIKRCHCFI